MNGDSEVVEAEEVQQSQSMVGRIAEPLYRAKGWMTFAGVLSIIQGIFIIFSLWGIIICWIPIWMGVVLCSASSHVRVAFETENDEEFRVSMQKLGTYFRIFGILALVSIVIAIIGVIAAVAIPALFMAKQAATGQM